jgi:hypothetical protein
MAEIKIDRVVHPHFSSFLLPDLFYFRLLFFRKFAHPFKVFSVVHLQKMLICAYPLPQTLS